MCGICGIANFDPRRPIDQRALLRMRDAVHYRGPDGAGIHVDRHVGLAHRRLSIIDLAGGHQPMSNEDGSVWITFNGEAYNYLELRRDYLDGRHQFRSSSDTEVIIHLYEEFGAACVERLNGMFAFGLWDGRANTLLLARDRVGVKPLYYTVVNGALLFASEIKCLLQHPDVRAIIDPVALDQFMTFGYVQTPRTALRDIFRVPEGHVLTCRDGAVSTRQYWDLDFTPGGNTSEAEHVERVAALLKDSIRLRLRSDVPVGVLLSGGLDSSAVVGLLSREIGKVKTFSIGFDAGHAYNELHHARRLAEHFGTEHHDVVLSPTEFRDFIPRLTYYMDEPVTEAAAVPLYFVCQLTAEHVKVVLSGEGSDELFAGYPIYRYMQLIEQYRRIPAPGRRLLADPLLRRLFPGPKIERYLQLAQAPIDRRYLNVHLYDLRLRGDFYSTDFASALGAVSVFEALDPVYQHTRHWDLLSRLLYSDTKTWLPNDILIKADRMSMANSIELRVPFLDYRLIEYAATIPSRYKLRGGDAKYVLKRVVRDVLPPWVVAREKMGFPTPIALMLRRELGTYVKDMLLDARTLGRGYFNPTTVRRWIDEHDRGTADRHSELWRLLVLEEWQRQMVDLPVAA